MSRRSPITSHVLDTSSGKPAPGIAVRLERRDGDRWKEIASGETDGDGRVSGLLGEGELAEATYRLTFETAAHFARSGRESFYPSVAIEFRIADTTQHYHVPLLISPFGYSTYRGS